MTTRLLLVEDEPALARGLADNFRDEGYEVRVVARGDEALAAVREARPDLVVLDIMLPGRSGLDVLRDLRAAGDDGAGADAHREGRRRGPRRGARARGRRLPAQALRGPRAPGPRARAPPPRGRREPPPDELTLGGVRFDFRALTATGGRPRRSPPTTSSC